ncbi:hypothetical protein SEA_GRAVAILLIA_19 [Mycobacterium phage Gravaillia]|uniref:Uncharacterized protein n=1 Tax=Mycobacterium phage Gancho TaxID=2301613 RepID=A0A385UCV1_9CAUD|nr:hypothetical protein SEA_GANCHO_18 [Mycobacterium phage Gancho]WAB10129.1 hypothetical protein SEA_GRAVAILLIA_19 [Mycobacterium phage Gravaillia]
MTDDDARVIAAEERLVRALRRSARERTRAAWAAVIAAERRLERARRKAARGA